MKRVVVWGLAAAAALVLAAVVWRAVSDPASSPLERAELAVLEREQSGDDRGAEAQGPVQLLKETGTRGVHVDAVRRVSGPGDELAVLVPIGEIPEHDVPDEAESDSNGLCLFYGSDGMFHRVCGGLHELRRGEIAGSGASWTGDAPDREPSDRDETTSSSRTTTPDPALVGGPLGVGPTVNADEIEQAPAGTPTHFYGLVPDGVARVVVTFSGAVPDASAEVANNFYDAVSTHPEASRRTGPIRWFDDEGQVVGPTR